MLKTPYLVFRVIIILFALTLGNEGTAYVEQERQRVNGGEFIMPRHQEVAGRGLLVELWVHGGGRVEQKWFPAQHTRWHFVMFEALQRFWSICELTADPDR